MTDPDIPNPVQAAIWHLFKACALAVAATCDDCAGDISVAFTAATAEWTVEIHHDPTCPSDRLKEQNR